jgi:maltose alpha-D-glucosyltransferase/alpha-amylase
VLALLYRWRGSGVLCVHNFDEQPHEVTLRLEDEAARRLLDLIHEEHSDADRSGRHRLALEAHGYRWFSVGTPDPSPRRRTDS